MSSSLGYPSRYLDALLKTVSPRKLDLQGVLSSLTSATAAVSAGPLDHFYARIGALNGPFFPAGWGNLSVVNYEEDLRHLIAGPPSNIKLSWRLLERGRRNGTDYLLYEGTFRTPCLQRVFDALPPESRTGRVQLLMPAHLQPFQAGVGDEAPTDGVHLWPRAVAAPEDDAAPAGPISALTAGGGGFAPTEAAPGPRQQAPRGAAGRPVDAPACVVHLAATGDQTFGRRLRLGFPLLKDNVCSLVLESPFYGARRPAAQRGSKLLRVSDLLTLGWATIAESLNLLHWLREEGFGALGMCGLSMGGVHASMTAGLFPGDVAVTPLLAPRSAAVAYCDGAMRAAMAWEPLLKEVDENNNRIAQVVMTAGRAVRVEVPLVAGAGAGGLSGPALGSGQCVALMREATYALVDMEVRGEKRHLAEAESGSGGFRHKHEDGSGFGTAMEAAAAFNAAAAAGASGPDAAAAAAAAVAAEVGAAAGALPGGGGGGEGGGGHAGGGPGLSLGAVLGTPFVSVMDLQRGLARAVLRTGGGSSTGGQAAAVHPTPAAAAAQTGASGRWLADDLSGPFSGIIAPQSPAETEGAREAPGGSRRPHAHPHHAPHAAPRTSSAPPAAAAAPGSGPAAVSAPGGRRPHPPPHAPDMPFPPQLPQLQHRDAAVAQATTTPASGWPAAAAAVAAGGGSSSDVGSAGGGTEWGRRLLGDLGRAVKQLRADDRRLDRPETVLRLKLVLETYTDITRYPRPRRTDAAVIVAARDDAYVSPESVGQLHRYWDGSELRMVSGGHVSAFLMHQGAFRAAIRDSLARVAGPPPQQQQQ